MLFSLLFVLVGRILGTGRRPDEGRDVERLVLRHQVRVLQRKVKRPRLRRLDRVLLAAASRVERCALQAKKNRNRSIDPPQAGPLALRVERQLK